MVNAAVLGLMGVGVLAACQSATLKLKSAADKVVFTKLVTAADVVSIIGQPDGRIRYAQRTGTISELRSFRSEQPTELVRLPVDTEDQRGLLGMATDKTGRLFASWVDTKGVLLVSRVETGLSTTVWTGPPTAAKANGGHLVMDSHGQLVIAIGDLSQGGARGVFYQLDPNGDATQSPKVLSTGWNNPFAYDITGLDHLWVADNSPGAQPERIGRGDTGNIIGTFSIKTAPAGLAVLSETKALTTVAICGFVSQRLDRWRITEKVILAEPLATNCTTAVTLLPDGRLAYATVDSIMISTAPIGLGEPK